MTARSHGYNGHIPASKWALPVLRVTVHEDSTWRDLELLCGLAPSLEATVSAFGRTICRMTTAADVPRLAFARTRRWLCAKDGWCLLGRGS